MGVPAEIRGVPRPKNTVVVDTGSKGDKRYAVRERAGTKYIPGGNPQPISGKVIGYIVDGKYCPREEPVVERAETEPQQSPQPQYLSYGVPALLQPLSQDLLAQLTAVYGLVDAESILAFASLEVMLESISVLYQSSDFEEILQSEYEESFLCVFYPNAKLSPRYIANLHKRIHTDTRSRHVWNAVRLNTVKEWEHLVISKGYYTVRSPEHPSDPGSIRVQDITVLYAYCLERLEPICFQIFPGEVATDAAYRSFLLGNDIRKGILLTDLDFPTDNIQDLLQDRPDLHVIYELPDEDPRISTIQIPGEQDPALTRNPDIHYSKSELPGGRFLYIYQDLSEDEEEEPSAFFGFWTTSEDDEEDRTKPPLVIESDLDVTPDELYDKLLSRLSMTWKLQYHNTRECVAATQSLMRPYHSGSTFVDFLASILKGRVWQKAAAVKSLQDYSYSGIISKLNLAYRQADAPPPTGRDDTYWDWGAAYRYDILEKLGIIPKQKRKRSQPSNIEDSE